MHIALTTSLVAPIRAAEANGPHSVVLDIAHGLTERGHDVTVFAASGSTGQGVSLAEIPVEPAAAGAAIRADGVTNARAQAALRRGFVQMFDELHRGRFDAVSQHAFDAPAFDLARNLPIAHTLHLPPIDAGVVAAARRSTAPLICVSQSSARDWQRAGVSGMTVIRNGVPDIASAPSTPDEPPFALVAGRISPEKGTVAAMRTARRAGLGVQVVGDVYDRNYFERDVAPLLLPGQDVAPLPRHELARLMTRAAVLVMPVGWEETYGLVAAEAQMAGCPVVAYRRGALSEIVIDGSTGYLVTPDDEDALVGAIHAALELDRDRIAACARSTLGVEQMVDRYEALLSSVAERAAAA